MIKDLTLWQGFGETVLIHTWKMPEPLSLAWLKEVSQNFQGRQGEEGIKNFREVCVLEWIHCVRQESPEVLPFIKAIRNVLFKGTQASFTSSGVVFFWRPGLMVGNSVTELGALITMGMRSWNNKCQIVALNCQEQRVNYLNELTARSEWQPKFLICRELLRWLVEPVGTRQMARQ